jgi:hypothetical protein
VSPQLLQITQYGAIALVGSFGHVAVEGTTSYQVQGAHRAYLHSVTFGFEFDQEQLVAAVGLPWVRRYAAADC